MRTIVVFVVVAGALLAASCVGTFHVGNRSSEPPAVVQDDRSSTPANLGIPLGHLPPPGMCRVWIPGQPPGHQPAPAACSRLVDEVPADAWLLYRPSGDRKHVDVSVYHHRRRGVVVAVRTYEAESGRYVGEGRTAAAR